MTNAATNPKKRPRVFLSFASEDRAVANRLIEELRKSRAPVTIDGWSLRAGDSITAKLAQQISVSDYLVVLLSPHSSRSKWVKWEVSQALEAELNQRATTVIPVIIADCHVPPALAGRLHFDLRTDFRAGVTQLAKGLSQANQLDLQSLDPSTFERLVADLLQDLGFSEIQPVRGGRDEGYDIKAHYRTQDPLGQDQSQTWLVQVKQYSKGRADLKSISEMVQ